MDSIRMVCARAVECKRKIHGLSIQALLWKPSSTPQRTVQPWVNALTFLEIVLISARKNNDIALSGLLEGLKMIIKSFNKLYEVFLYIRHYSRNWDTEMSKIDQKNVCLHATSM